MEKASRYRALASLYRQQAAYSPFNSWHLLGQAERWEHLAEAEISDHFKDCNTTNCRDVCDTQRDDCRRVRVNGGPQNLFHARQENAAVRIE